VRFAWFEKSGGGIFLCHHPISFHTETTGVDVITFQRMSGFLALTLMVAATAGCATGGAGNGGGSTSVRMDMGISNFADFTEQTGDLFRRTQFTVFRTDQPPAPLIESQWRNQTPTADEQALGVTEVQTRIIVRGRERNPIGGMRVFQFTYFMEILYKTATSQEWIEMPVTEEREDFAEDLGQELKTLLLMARG
jgi:hypothetical protein